MVLGGMDKSRKAAGNVAQASTASTQSCSVHRSWLRAISESQSEGRSMARLSMLGGWQSTLLIRGYAADVHETS